MGNRRHSMRRHVQWTALRKVVSMNTGTVWMREWEWGPLFRVRSFNAMNWWFWWGVLKAHSLCFPGDWPWDTCSILYYISLVLFLFYIIFTQSYMKMVFQSIDD